MAGQFTLHDIVEKHCALGEQKRCTKCHELWPADPEFFFVRRGKRSGLCSQCRACMCEASTQRKRRKAA